MNEEINSLVEMIFDISQKIDDWEYMKIMVCIQKINAFRNENVNEFELKYYKLVKTHNRLKKQHKQIAKLRREQMENMEITIEELQNQIQYLEQNRPKDVELKDYLVLV